MLILRLVSEFLPLLAIGYFIGRFKKELSSQISGPLIKYGIPISLMALLLKTGLDWLLFQAFLMALFAIGLLLAIISSFPSLRRNINNRSLLLGSVFANSGYFGIPVSLALLPSHSLSFSIGYDLGSTLLVWSLGPLFLGNSSSGFKGIAAWQNLFTALIASPASKGLIGALFIQLTPWSDQFASVLWIPSRIVIALALMILGMRLGSIDTEQKITKRKALLLIQPSLLIKLIIFPALMLLLSKAFSLSTPMCNALVLQAATPTAISVLLLAEVSDDKPHLVASLVAWSTFIGLITVPIWFLLLQ